MRALVVILVALGAGFGLSSAMADPPAADRYELKPADGGFLRLDRESGLTAFCAATPDGYACKPTAEGGSAEAAMTAQLERRVAALEAKLNVLTGDDPAALKSATPRDPTLDLPNDAQVDRVATFLERAFKRFRKLASEMQRDMENEPL